MSGMAGSKCASEDRLFRFAEQFFASFGFWERGDSNLPGFSQLKDHAPGFEIGGSGDPGFWIVNFVAEKSGVPNQA